MEEPFIWLPTSKAFTRSGGYVTAVIEASVGGGNCRKGKLSGWVWLFKMKAGATLAAMRTLLQPGTSVMVKPAVRRAAGMAYFTLTCMQKTTTEPFNRHHTCCTGEEIWIPRLCSVPTASQIAKSYQKELAGTASTCKSLFLAMAGEEWNPSSC